MSLTSSYFLMVLPCEILRVLLWHTCPEVLRSLSRFSRMQKPCDPSVFISVCFPFPNYPNITWRCDFQSIFWVDFWVILSVIVLVLLFWVIFRQCFCNFGCNLDIWFFIGQQSVLRKNILTRFKASKVLIETRPSSLICSSPSQVCLLC